MSSVLENKTFVVVTGASQGIGRKIAVEFGKLLGSNSTILLLARSLTNLTETKKLVTSNRSDVNVELECVDFNEPDYKKYIEIFKRAVKEDKFNYYILIHNAGNIISDTFASEITDVEKWNKYMTVNLYAATILNSAFLTLAQKQICTIVNITSLCGREPFKGLSLYGTAKASRDMFFKVLAEENPELRVLNYSPGPIDTDMYDEIAKNCCSSEIREIFNNMKQTNQLVKIDDTVQKLITILKRNTYKNGSVIDYMDEI